EGLQQPGFPADWWRTLGDPTAQNPYLVEVREGAEAVLEIALVKAAAIHGRVLGQDDQGIAGALVSFANAGDAAAEAGAGGDGSFRLEGARSGSVALSLTKDDYVPLGATVAEVPESGELAGLVLRMTAAPRVRGRVTCRDARLGEAYVQVSMV